MPQEKAIFFTKKLLFFCKGKIELFVDLLQIAKADEITSLQKFIPTIFR
jgi:hypothetical protein